MDFEKIFIKKAKPTSIGGQSVMEGVMMRGPDRTALALRLPTDEVYLKTEKLKPEGKNKDIPIIRGIVAFAKSLAIGMHTLMESAGILEEYLPEEEDEEPSAVESFLTEKFGEKAVWNLMIGTSVAVSIIITIVVFVIFPTVIVNLLDDYIASDIVLNLIEGVFRILLFVLYILAISKMKDIKKLFQYHGAEHKTIHCFENDRQLTPENAKEFETLHPRCGTSFLMFVMIISLVLFSLLGWPNVALRITSRILLIPVIAGLSYEILRWAGRTDNMAVRILSVPGLLLQRLTTKNPNDQQLFIAIISLKAVLVAKDVPTFDGVLTQESFEKFLASDEEVFEEQKRTALEMANLSKHDVKDNTVSIEAIKEQTISGIERPTAMQEFNLDEIMNGNPEMVPLDEFDEKETIDSEESSIPKAGDVPKADATKMAAAIGASDGKADPDLRITEILYMEDEPEVFDVKDNTVIKALNDVRTGSKKVKTKAEIAKHIEASNENSEEGSEKDSNENTKINSAKDRTTVTSAMNGVADVGIEESDARVEDLIGDEAENEAETEVEAEGSAQTKSNLREKTFRMHKWSEDPCAVMNTIRHGREMLTLLENGKQDADDIFCYVMGFSHADIITRGEEVLRQDDIEEYNRLLEKRLTGTPLQYITRVQEFMGLPFRVNESVLIPRLDTEILAEQAIGIVNGKAWDKPEILDLCTGSGVLGITLAHEIEDAEVTLSDISNDALNVAMNNAQINDVFRRCSFVTGDLFDALMEDKKFNMIVCNPPYIESSVIPTLAIEVKEHEPMLALDGGEDGLDIYRRIAKEAARHIYPGGILAMEIGYDQAKSVSDLLAKTDLFNKPAIIKDLNKKDRVLIAERKGIN